MRQHDRPSEIQDEIIIGPQNAHALSLLGDLTRIAFALLGAFLLIAVEFEPLRIESSTQKEIARHVAASVSQQPVISLRP